MRVLQMVVLACAILSTESLVRSTAGSTSSQRTLSTGLDAGAKIDSSEVKQDYTEHVMTTYGKYPITISHGKGCELFDTEGKRYIDFAAGIATSCLGHANPRLKQAIMDQMDRYNHVSNLYFIPEQGKLAKWITSNSCADKVFFCNSGAEANEAAIKLARKHAHTKLGVTFPVIITALQSFHGRTLTAITATGQPKYQKNFGPLTPGFEYVPYNDLEALRAKVKEVQAAGGGMGLAAIMMESLQGEGGIIPGDKAFFQGVRELCDETGAIMVVDEVQTGVGRTGKMWGYEHLGVTPDVFTSAKALGAGVPIGAMCCVDKYNVFEPGDHASTYGGNPLACAAGLAVANEFDNHGLLQNVLARSAQFDALSAQLAEKFPTVVKEVRGWGLMRGIEIAESCPLTSAQMAAELMEKGLLIVPAGPKVIRFVPPLVMSETEMVDAMALVEAAFTELMKK